MFKALNFSINKVAGTTFNLIIANFGGNGNETQASAKIEPFFTEMYRRDEPYFLGATMGNDTMELPITFVSTDGEVDRQKLSQIKRSLFNFLHPVTLKVLQSDLTAVSYRGIFTSSDPVSLGNGLYGIETTFKLMSNFAVEGVVTRNLGQIFFNNSDSPRGLKPIIEFKMNANGGEFAIENLTNGIKSQFTGLAGGEEITLNCDKQIITSSLDLRRLGNFNKKWMKFDIGKNQLVFTGNGTDVKVTYQNKKSVG